MQLHQALQKAAQFAATGKGAPDLYQSVQLISGDGEATPSRVFATDGLVGCLIDVDVDLPMALLGLEAAKPVAKQAVIAVERDGNEVRFRLEAGGVYKMATKEVMGWPAAPSLPPVMEPVTHWRWIRKVLHAAAQPRDGKPTFSHVRLRPGCAEATDSFRVSVAEVPAWREDRVVPARLFKGWKGHPRPLAYFDAERAWFRVGAELRWAPVRGDVQFPDCHKLLPTDYDGPSLAVDAKKLLGAVRRATAVSTLKTVALDFSGPELAVKSWSAAEGGKAFRAVLVGRATDPLAKAIKVISGKLLVQALGMVETPNVRLCYRDVANEPLRLESGLWAESLWPWKVADGS